MRVLVTSSRTWSDRTTLDEALDAAAGEARRRRERLTVVHGACPKGGDALARQWVRQRRAWGWPVDEEAHPAEWTTGRGAGFARNAVMVALGAELCLAFADACARPDCKRPPGHISHGTEHCAGLAAAAGIEVRMVAPGGRRLHEMTRDGAETAT